MKVVFWLLLSHGGVVLALNDANKGTDAPNNINASQINTFVLTKGKYEGFLSDKDPNDCYKIKIDGVMIVYMLAPKEANFTLYLYDKNKKIISTDTSTYQQLPTTDDLTNRSDFYRSFRRVTKITGKVAYLRVHRVSGFGTYTLKILTSPMIFIVSPHPDDEIIGFAGVISKALNVDYSVVKVIVVTNGDAYKVSAAAYLRKEVGELTSGDYVKLGCYRQRESRWGLVNLGLHPADIDFLGFPDGFLYTLLSSSDHTLLKSKKTAMTRTYGNTSYIEDYYYKKKVPYTKANLIAALKQILSNNAINNNSQIYTTHPDDGHYDHRAVYWFVVAALRELNLENINIYSPIIHKPRYIGWYVFLHDNFWPPPSSDGNRKNRYKPYIPVSDYLAPLKKVVGHRLPDSYIIYLSRDCGISPQRKWEILMCYASQIYINGCLVDIVGFMLASVKNYECFFRSSPLSARKNLKSCYLIGPKFDS